MLEILAQSGYSGLSTAEVDEEMKRRGLGGTRGVSAAAFLIDRFVGRGHVRKMARLVANPPATRGTNRGGGGGKEGGNKRVLFSRLTRYHGPVGGELVERAKTGDEVVDAARATLYAEQGKNIAQTICDHFTVMKAGAAATAAGVADGAREEGLVMAKMAGEVRVGLDDVARLMRMDGPTARALVQAMQYREFDDRSALRVWWVEEEDEEERGKEEEGEEDEDECEIQVEGTSRSGRKGDRKRRRKAAALPGYWLVVARPPTLGGMGTTNSGGEVVRVEEEEEGGREGGLEGVGEEGLGLIGPWGRPLCVGNVMELDEVRQIYRLTLLRGQKGMSVPDVERMLGMGNKRANRLLTMIVNKPMYGVRALKVTHGRTAAYRLFGPSVLPEEERREGGVEGGLQLQGVAGGREREEGEEGEGKVATMNGDVKRGEDMVESGAEGGRGPRREMSVLELVQGKRVEGGKRGEEWPEEGKEVILVAREGVGGEAGAVATVAPSPHLLPPPAPASVPKAGGLQQWHKTFTGLRRRRMELTFREVQRAGCLMEIDIARYLRAHDGAHARQMDRKSVRRLLGDLEEQVSVLVVG